MNNAAIQGAKEGQLGSYVAAGRRSNCAIFCLAMTVLRDFIDEIASELDARTDKPLAPHHWIGFVKLVGAIDQDDEMSELRQQIEQIVSQRDLRFQDRCLALIPLLSADPAIADAFTRRRRAAIAALAAL